MSITISDHLVNIFATMTNDSTVVFLGNGRCYHTMDWFRSAQSLQTDQSPILITDLLDGESFAKLVVPSDNVENLFIIDKFLFRTQSRLGNAWRNIVKMMALPIQILRLRKLLQKLENPIVHAHSTYYIVMARFSKCAYVATPQGSEILVRPLRSKVYREFARIGLSGASRITVDSTAMQAALESLYGLPSIVIQNGINVDAIRNARGPAPVRDKVISIRGFASNYRIDRILDARNDTLPDVPLHFCYPFFDETYRKDIAYKFQHNDHDLGRLPRNDLYDLARSAKLAISIPGSDSSPRSVYEAIFCGCLIAATDAAWIYSLPDCMRARILIVDIRSRSWLSEAVKFADGQIHNPYIPSPQALELFDQKMSMKKIYDEIFPLQAFG